MGKKKEPSVYYRLDDKGTQYKMNKNELMMGFLRENWNQMTQAHIDANRKRKPGQFNRPGQVTVIKKVWDEILVILGISKNTKVITIIYKFSAFEFVQIRANKYEGTKK